MFYNNTKSPRGGFALTHLYFYYCRTKLRGVVRLAGYVRDFKTFVAYFMQQLRADWNKIPNLFTFFRILLSPVPAYLLLQGQVETVFSPVVYWYVFVAATDLDGFIARALNQKTELGRMLDPLADLLLAMTMLTALGITSKLDWYLIVYAILGQITIAIYLVYAKRNGKDVGVLWSGKVKTFVLAFAMGFLIMPQYGVWQFISESLVFSLKILFPLSWLGYIRKFRWY